MVAAGEMTPLLGTLAHAVHHLLLYGGIAVLVLLLVHSRPRKESSSATTVGDHDHALRVAALRVALAGGGPVDAAGDARDATSLSTHPLTPTQRRPTEPPLGRDAGAGSGVPTPLVVALVSSAAAAGVHGAAVQSHLAAGWLVSGFFLLAATAQLVWAAALLVHPRNRGLVMAGAAGNLGVIALWALTRTVGLPFGLAPVEAVGPWDLAATAWEALVVWGALAWSTMLRHSSDNVSSCPTAPRMTDLVQWSPRGRAFLAVSVALLLLLTLTGAPT